MKIYTYEMKDPQRDGELRGRFTVADGEHDLPLPADEFEAHDRGLRQHLEQSWRDNRVPMSFENSSQQTNVLRTAAEVAKHLRLEFVLIDEDALEQRPPND
jgi:hypothetical protein